MVLSRTLYVAMLLAALGCSRAMHTRPIVPPPALTAEEKDFQAVWDAASEVLVSYRFKIDQLDRRSGTITTHRLAGRHFFEWWRHDDVSARGALENTIQPMYRTARVRIVKKSAGQYDPVVEIVVSRILARPVQAEPRWTHTEGYTKDKKKDKPQYEVIAEGTSDVSEGARGKGSKEDNALAREIAERIRVVAYRMRSRLH